MRCVNAFVCTGIAQLAVRGCKDEFNSLILMMALFVLEI